MKKLLVLINILLFITGYSQAQIQFKPNPELLSKNWDAKWITHPKISGEEIGVYLFKKKIQLESVPDQFIINVSADNRYKLYVNGQIVCNGPERGDLLKWRFETIDIAPYLIKGENVVCAKVWNFAQLRPVAQITSKTGFIVQGNSEIEKIINTNQDWKVMIDSAYTLHSINHLQEYYVTGPGEKFDGNHHPWKWQSSEVDATTWMTAKELEQGMSFKSIRKYGNVPAHALYPREIPLMELKKQYFLKVRRTEGITDASALLTEKDDLTIPANSTVSILFDQGELTNAYPQLSFSKGKNSSIKLTYAESLFNISYTNGNEIITKDKGNRNDIENKKINGNFDIIICDGGEKRNYETLWWRTFRYIQLDITTKDMPLQLHQFYSLFTGYPLAERATFSSSEPKLTQIFKQGWHTQRLCAGETFFDCPYYEQLQYSGDTRIQGLVTYYVSGDTLLWRKSITDFYDSRLPNGLTQSRYPCYETQIIPTYSLVWITMLWDYMMFCNDREFIKSMLPAVQDILQWYDKRLDKNNLPIIMEGWNFVDWVNYKEWDSGTPPMDNEKQSAIIALQYVYTIQKAMELYKQNNWGELASYWESKAELTRQAVAKLCWNESRGLFADTPEKRTYSQHANIFAVLTNAVPTAEQKKIIEKIYKDTTIAQASLYFQFYLAEALKKTGLGKLYLETLKPWETMLQNGLTTFSETSDPTRSDCHAWSASPLYYFYSMICGIEPANQGFTEIKIAPNFGKLEWIEAKMSHRFGEISIQLKKIKTEKISGQITLPKGLSGQFYWNKKQIELLSGITIIDL